MRPHLAFALVALVVCSGCTQLPPLNFIPKEVPRLNPRLDADLRSVSVTVAQPEEKLGALDFNFQYSQMVPDLWKTAVEDSLNRALAFSDASDRKVNLRVKILQFDMPKMGFAMTTKTAASYEIVDRATGVTLFKETINAEGVVPMDYAFMGVVRSMESANRAVQNNVLAFVNALSKEGIKAYPATGHVAQK